MSEANISDVAPVEDENSNAGSVEPKVQPEQGDSVSIDTHRRLLAQRKKDQQRIQDANARLAEFEEMERQKQQTELEAKGEYDKILKAKDEELQALRARTEAEAKARIDSAKEAAFINSLPGKLRNQSYLSYMDKEAIAIDPDTGNVDQGSLKQAVDKFVQEHGILIEGQAKSTSLPNQSPSAPENLLGDPKMSNEQKLIAALAQQQK